MLSSASLPVDVADLVHLLALSDTARTGKLDATSPTMRSPFFWMFRSATCPEAVAERVHLCAFLVAARTGLHELDEVADAVGCALDQAVPMRGADA